MSASSTTTSTLHRLTGRDIAILFAFCLLLFGYSCMSGKPLAMHEARLPQLAREMLHSGDWHAWLVPHSGARPWLERPPLPQWIVACAFAVFGESVAVARLPGAIAGALTCCFVALTGARLFGRHVGLVAGFALATMYEFLAYATLAEDEVYLACAVAACVWTFVRACDDGDTERKEKREMRKTGEGEQVHTPSSLSPFLFPLPFFLLLALTHLIRGPAVGMIQVGSVVGSYLIACAVLDRSWRSLFAPWGPIVWIIGLLFSIALGALWYVFVDRIEPTLSDNLRYDFFSGWGADPWWYYGPTLLWTTLPWTIFALIALVPVLRGVRFDRSRLFAFCWAIVPVIVMSIPARKNHHYLVPVLAGWALLGSIGLTLVWEWGCRRNEPFKKVVTTYSLVGIVIAIAIVALSIGGKLEGPVWLSSLVACIVAGLTVAIGVGAARQRAPVAFASFLACFFVVACWQQSVHWIYDDKRMADERFVRDVERLVPSEAPVFVIAKESLDFFQQQFFLRPSARTLQNTTWLLDRAIQSRTVYVVTRKYDVPWIEEHVGPTELVLEPPYSRREEEVGGSSARFVLLKVTYKPDAVRADAVPIDALQAMRRPDPADESPYLGPPNPTRVPDGADKPAFERRH